MQLLKEAVGQALPPLSVRVDRGRLQLFAKAIGERSTIYWDLDAAVAAGHPDLPVPPTFLFGLELERPEPFAWLRELGVDLNTVLHGTQSFEYASPAHAGDVLTVLTEITDVYEKQAGRLHFVDRRSVITRDGVLVATLHQTIVVRNQQVAA